MTMKLHDFAFSPNSRKVRAVAYELGIPLEYVHVDLVRNASRAPAFLQLNPNGRVPVLVDGDLVLWESTAILRYLSAKRGGACQGPASLQHRNPPSRRSSRLRGSASATLSHDQYSAVPKV
ncbi:MAG: glutathione S-transferase N-terminal domain-containing protein [Polyangiaceae bacterium]